jgi:hypothetical protein
LAIRKKPIGSRRLRRRDRGTTTAERTPDNLLSYLDQAMFLGLRATGHESVMQGVWIYEHPVDMDGLRRFHRNFGHGIAGRRIEPSPLPFGRHRWVSTPGPATEMDVATVPITRAELSDWIDERAQRTVDPVRGPGWHLAVQPLTDGSTAVTLVGSHCLGDGGGALLTVYEAVTGNLRDLGYPPPGSRTRTAALAEDTRQVVRDLPELGRTLRRAARALVQRRDTVTGARDKRPTPVSTGDPDEIVREPAVAVFIDSAEWDARADALGGNSYSLLAGIGARMSQHVGRHRPGDGPVPFIVPFNDRDLTDTRANAVTLATPKIDPQNVTSDLSGVRAAIKEASTTMREVPDETLALLPVTPFIPKRAVKASANMAFGFAGLPVSCSNMGSLPDEIGRIDGTDAEYVIFRGVDRNITRRDLDQLRGLLTVVAGRVGGTVSVAVIGYQPGEVETKAHLRELTEKTLTEFGLTGMVI